MIDLAFHHVGVGTTTFERAIATYEALGYALRCNVDDPGLHVRVAFLARPGHPLVEIVAPLGDDHPLKSLIARKQLPSPYHTCYAVPDLDAAAARLRELGFLPLGEPAPALALGGARIQYLYGGAVGLVELAESPAPEWA
ncbi:MAG: VOC family protein [Alphaproteobacteria bacterium]|nr:VOC family protein [Alphaproteobacteria bacterium]